MALNKGALITADFVREPDGNKKVYRLSSTGRAIRASVVEQMIEDELIRPYSDGLPGLGEPQSWALWRASDGGA